MKKIFFLFVMLASITANATVTVTPLSVDYAAKKVTFKVAWTGTAAPNRVWVWVDLCPVAGTTPGTFAKAVLSNPATIPTGSLVTVDGNTRGFYVTTNPSTVTATLDNATGKFNWCAYGSDYPPNAIETSGAYTLKGSPPFLITTTTGTVEVSGKTYSGGTITAFTDATGCPGVLCGVNGESAGLLNCCVTGTENCSGTCTANRTYTTNDGSCAGACNTAYVQERNQCGVVINAQYSTYTNTGCTTPNYTTNDGACAGTCNTAYVQLRNACGVVINAQYSTYINTGCTTPNYTTNDGACAGTCNTAYVQLRNACGVVINAKHSTYANSGCIAGCCNTGIVIVNDCSQCAAACLCGTAGCHNTESGAVCICI